MNCVSAWDWLDRFHCFCCRRLIVWYDKSRPTAKRPRLNRPWIAQRRVRSSLSIRDLSVVPLPRWLCVVWSRGLTPCLLEVPVGPMSCVLVRDDEGRGVVWFCGLIMPVWVGPYSTMPVIPGSRVDYGNSTVWWTFSAEGLLLFSGEILMELNFRVSFEWCIWPIRSIYVVLIDFLFGMTIFSVYSSMASSEATTNCTRGCVRSRLTRRFWVFKQCNVPPIRVLHVSSCSVQSTSKSSFCGCLRFRIIRSFWFSYRPRTEYWYLEEWGIIRVIWVINPKKNAVFPG